MYKYKIYKYKNTMIVFFPPPINPSLIIVDPTALGEVFHPLPPAHLHHFVVTIPLPSTKCSPACFLSKPSVPDKSELSEQSDPNTHYKRICECRFPQSIKYFCKTNLPSRKLVFPFFVDPVTWL